MSELKKDEHNLKRNLLFNTAGSMFYFICQWLITGLLVERLAGVYNAGLLATAMTVTNVFGYGVQKGHQVYYRGAPVEARLLPKMKIDVVISKIPAETLAEILRRYEA